MKIDCLHILICLLAAGLGPLLAQADSPVEIRNAGFEQVDAQGNALGWSAHPNWKVINGTGYNGGQGFHFSCANAATLAPGSPGQRVVLKPGKRYRLSAMAKAEGIQTERASRKLGMTILVSGYDAQEKWVFDCIADPCVQGKSKDWITLECLSSKLPDNVTHGFIRPYTPCCWGEGTLDNVYLEEIDEAPVAQVNASAYRHEAVRGNVTFHAELNLPRDRKPSDYTARFIYRSAAGKEVAVSGQIKSQSEAWVELEVEQMALGTQDVSCVLSLGGKDIGRASTPFTRVPHPTPRRVYIDEHHRTIVDGKPFFPLGMFMRDVTASNLDIYAAAPFNALMPYQAPDRAGFDLCQKRGYKVIYNLQGGLNDPDAGKANVTWNVKAFRDHPALLAWYTNDELPMSEIPKLKRRQLWVEELDPHHPTWVVTDKSALPFMKTFDVLGLDRYPVSAKPIEEVIETIREGRAAVYGTRALWMVPQTFGWNWLPRTTGQDQLAPTREQMANMIWQSIAGGANGVLCWAFHRLIGPHSTCNNKDEFTWADLCAVIREVKALEDVFLAVEPAVQTSGVPSSLQTRAWRLNGEDYLLIVNCTARRQQADITLSRAFTHAEVVGQGPLPKLQGKSLKIDFAPLAHTMLKLR